MQGMQAALPGSFSVREAVHQLYGFSGEVERHAQVGSRQSSALVCIVLHIVTRRVWNFSSSVVSVTNALDMWGEASCHGLLTFLFGS